MHPSEYVDFLVDGNNMPIVLTDLLADGFDVLNDSMMVLMY